MGDMADWIIDNGELAALEEPEEGICFRCQGTGYKGTQKNLEDCSFGDYSIYNVCDVCNGAGRIL